VGQSVRFSFKKNKILMEKMEKKLNISP